MLLSITKLDENGDGVGTHEGQTYVMPYGLPGDVVDITLNAVVEPSLHRITPPCPYFMTCGGCLLQHLEPGFYRSYKREQVQTILDAEGVTYPAIPDPVSVAPGTRRRMTLKAERAQGKVSLGFYQRQSHTLVPIEKCLLISGGMNGLLGSLQQLLDKMLPDLGKETAKESAKASIQVTETDTGLDVLLELPPMVSTATYYEDMVGLARTQDLARLSVVGYGLVYMARTPAIKVGPVEIPTLADGFLQASSEGEHLLINLLQQTLKGQKDLKILELFSGIGTFTVSLAQHGAVMAYEGAAAPVETLKQVAKRYQLPVQTQVRDLFKRPLATDELQPYDIVVLDPPRLGAIHQCRQLAEASHLSKIIYIACHPKTFARDARILQKGDWKLTQLNLVDQFLWSQHVELFSVWERG